MQDLLPPTYRDSIGNLAWLCELRKLLIGDLLDAFAAETACRSPAKRTMVSWSEARKALEFEV